MGEALFQVHVPLWWYVAFYATLPFLTVWLWRRAEVELPKAVVLARMAVVVIALGGGLAYGANLRHGVTVFPGSVVLTPRFSTERPSYSVDRIRWWDPMGVETGVGKSHRFRRALTLGFDDGTEFQILEGRTNFERLRSWLIANEIHERAPWERPPVQH